jgi:hypothetical protein
MKLRITAVATGAGLVFSLAACGDSGKDSKPEAKPEPSTSATTSAPATTSPTAAPPSGTPGGESPAPDTTGRPPQRPPVNPPASRPPQKPTDTVVPGWVVGTVTAASSGPCYGMVTDDGRQYALYSSAGYAVRRGERIRVQVDQLKLRIYCGPGMHAAVKAYEKVS